MTSSSEYALSCKCGHEFKADLYNSINVTLDSSLLEKLFKGKINVVICPKCKTEAYIPIDVVFHDMDKNLMIVAEKGNLGGLIRDLESKGLYHEFKGDSTKVDSIS